MKSKLFLLFSLFLLIAIQNIAQTQIRSQTIIGGTENDYLGKLCLDKNGFLVAGNSDSDSSKYKSQNGIGGTDIWVVKYSRNKVSGQPKKAWDKTIGGVGDDVLVDARTARDGGFIFLGYFASGTPDDNTPGYRLIKLRNNGIIAWQKGISSDILYGMDTTNDGGFVLVGKPGLIKTDALGNVLWAKPINTDHPYNSIVQAKDGGYLLANLAGDVTKTDTEGNILWTKNYNDLGFEYSVYKVYEANNGSIFLSEALEWDDSPNGNYPQYNNRLYKLDANGNKQWEYDVAGWVFSLAMSALQTRDGGFIIGSTINLGDYDQPYTADYLTKLNASGVVEWKRTITGAASFADLVEPVTGMYVVASNADGSCGSCGDKTKPPVGKWDYWIVALEDTASDENSKQSNSIAATIKTQLLKLYPNPASNELHVNSNQPSDIVIFNQKGQVVLKKTLGRSGTISVQHLQNGVYFVKDNHTGAVQKLIIQH